MENTGLPNLAAQSALQNFLSRGYTQNLYGVTQIDPTPTTTRTPSWKPSANPQHGPMPPIDMITYATVGVFDNGNKPETYTDPFTGKTRKRQKANRFKVSIDCWTKPPHAIQKHKGGEFSRGIWVKPAADFLKLIVLKNQEGKTFTDAQATWMNEIVGQDLNAFYGVIYDRDGGFTYFPDQMIRMSADQFGMPIVTFFIGDDTMTADRMTAEFLTDRQRASGVIAQEYLDRCGYSAYWTKHKAPTTKTPKYQPKPRP